jgi:hypothetical protein
MQQFDYLFYLMIGMLSFPESGSLIETSGNCDILIRFSKYPIINKNAKLNGI